MKITATRYDLDPKTWTGGLQVATGHDSEPRSPGLHVGGVLRDIENRAIKPGKREATSTLSNAERSRMGNYVEMGFIWEVLVEQVFRQRMLSRRHAQAGVVSQQERQMGGMALTPDGWCPLDDKVEEYKATWTSMRRAEPPEGLFDAHNHWGWGKQNQCYCRAWDTRKGRFFVFWVNGDYRDSGPQIVKYDVEWTQAEIEETWRMVTTHAARMA
jgi:hypothetical protein